MARAHPDQHAPIQLVLHRDHPLFRFLEQERGHLGQSRAGYLRWLLEQQFLHARGERGSPAPVLEVAPTADDNLRALMVPEQQTLEPDDDLLASFVS